MPQILKTIEDYVVNDRKRDTYFMVFNTVYNDIITPPIKYSNIML